VPTYRLDVEYLGTRYHGWQEQKNARSVAGELRRAAEESGAQVIELGGAGRTDAGVHALRQTAHLRLRAEVDPAPFREAVGSRLPHDVHVLSILRAHDSFHARHSAIARSYLYQISRRRTGLAKRGVWWVREGLDERRMAEAAASIVGRHDFRLFCERPAEQPSTLVVVEQVQVVPQGDLVLVRLVASHFLWKMVRRLVGVLVRVGCGHLGLADLARLLQAEPLAGAEADPARHTAPAAGLFLERVLYPGEPPLDPPAAVLAVGRALPSGVRWFVGRGETPAPASRRNAPQRHPAGRHGGVARSKRRTP
jgi:tRNA pseudouridine38-40 synthase